jgi:uncharacterized membrane protein (UPF0127 family)
MPNNQLKPSLSFARFASVAWTAALALCAQLAISPAIGWAQNGPAPEPQMHLPRVTLQAGMYRIDAQVASTELQREIGLMSRPSMPMHEGMLFVFEQASPQCFWMKNTLIPLSAAFIDADGTIANIEDMKAQTTDSHCSKRPVPYVLEMNLGWFAQRGLKAGSKLGGAPFTSKP